MSDMSSEQAGQIDPKQFARYMSEQNRTQDISRTLQAVQDALKDMDIAIQEYGASPVQMQAREMEQGYSNILILLCTVIPALRETDMLK